MPVLDFGLLFLVRRVASSLSMMRQRKEGTGMRKVRLGMALAAVLVLALSAHVGAADVFVAQLTGDQETPPNSSGASGLAVLVLNDAQDTLTFRVDYGGLEGGTVSGAHFHRGDPGVAGGIIRGYNAEVAEGDFTIPDGSLILSWTAGDKQPLTADRIDQLFNGEIYFNIHTTPTYPGGEIRGQVYYWFSY
jgi:hypothetical protein